MPGTLISAGFVFVLLICTGLFFSCRKKYLFGLLLALTIGVIGCSKSGKEVQNKQDHIFIRIAQVNIDGTRSYSKIINVTKN